MMKDRLLLIALLAILALGGAGGQEPEAEPEEETPAQTEGADTDEDVERATADDVFVPSERISADQEVIFPVDI